jgi:3-dehydroquinate synthase
MRMSELLLQIDQKKSRVVIQNGALDHIGAWVSSLDAPPVVLVCSDETVAGLYADRVLASLHGAGLVAAHLHTLPPGDGSKSLAELERIYGALGSLHLARDGLLLALGGGVVSDLTGFAAATWMRGVRYMTCPTTLESAVDACVGGKTAINHPAGKNLIGAFHHAERVVIDPDCLRTLPARDVSAGLAESVKHALIADPGFLDWHEAHRDDIRAGDPDVMAELIERNLRIKISVVESDEREHGKRAILNFGHTIGHAIEQCCAYALRHGEAIALGMLAALRLSQDEGMISAAELARVRELLESFDLPVALPANLHADAIADLTRGDKKVRGGERRWVVLDGLGHPRIVDGISDDQVRAAIGSLARAD